MKKLAFLLLLGGCAAPSWPLPSEPPPELADVLKPGTTRRDDVLRRWGAPSFRDDQERVIAYRAAFDGFGDFRAVEGAGRFRWNGVQYHVLLAFDEAQVLEKLVVYKLLEESPW